MNTHSFSHTHTFNCCAPQIWDWQSQKQTVTSLQIEQKKSHCNETPAVVPFFSFCWTWKYDVVCHCCIVGNRTDALSSPVTLWEKKKEKKKRRIIVLRRSASQESSGSNPPVWFPPFPRMLCDTHQSMSMTSVVEFNRKNVKRKPTLWNQQMMFFPSLSITCLLKTCDAFTVSL